MVNIRVSSYDGPSILDLDPVLNEVQGDVEVSWTNTKSELRALEKYPHRTFILHVNDSQSMERTAVTLGQPFQLDHDFMEKAWSYLNSKKSYNWRTFVDGVGVGVSRCLITKISANAIRKGKQPLIAAIATDCVLNQTNPIDADVFFRLSVLTT